MLRPGGHKEEVDPEHREEDAERGQLPEVSHGDAAPPHTRDAILLDLGPDHHDHIDKHEEVDSHDDNHGDPDEPGAVPEVHPAVAVLVDEAEQSVWDNCKSGESPTKKIQEL